MQIRPSWLLALTISACMSQLISPLHAQTERSSQQLAKDTTGPTEHLPLPKCMSQWYYNHLTTQEWLQACEHAYAEEPNYNAAYARCLADWDPQTQMTKSEWHKSCASVVKQEPGAFELGPK